MLCDILALESEDLSANKEKRGREWKCSHSTPPLATVRPRPATADLHDPRRSAGRRRLLKRWLGRAGKSIEEGGPEPERRRSCAGGGEGGEFGLQRK